MASAGGECALPVERITGHGVGQIVALEDRGDQLTATVHAGPVEFIQEAARAVAGDDSITFRGW
jgi:hypothetical protein